jgi:hypothetical protein
MQTKLHIQRWVIALSLLGACGGTKGVSQLRAPVPDPIKSTSLPGDLRKLELLCLEGNAEACQSGGSKLDFGDFAATGEKVKRSEEQQKKDQVRARDFYWAGCRLDDGESCERLARLEKDEEQRRTLEEKACRLGAGSACSMLGQHALTDERLRDAYRYMKLGCNAGNDSLQLSCRLLQRLTKNGWGDEPGDDEPDDTPDD